jgi:hypothetical protein
MGVTKTTIKEGDGENYPKKGDKLVMHYTGTLKSNGTKVRYETVGEYSIDALTHTSVCLSKTVSNTQTVLFYVSKISLTRRWTETSLFPSRLAREK